MGFRSLITSCILLAGVPISGAALPNAVAPGEGGVQPLADRVSQPHGLDRNGTPDPLQRTIPQPEARDAEQADFSMVNSYYSTNPAQASMVQLYDASAPSKQICEGTVLSDHWILTAGHCVTGLNVVVALNDDAPNERTYPVKTILHPRYSQPTLGVNLGTWDVALLKIAKPIDKPVMALATSTNPTQPSLSDDLTSPNPKDPAGSYQDASRKVLQTVIGHGVLTPGGKLSSLPREADLQSITLEACASQWNTTRDAITGYQCAIAKKPKRGQTPAVSCQGDSGAPLLIRTTTGKYMQTGVLSGGAANCDNTKPTVFTDVTQLRLWIDTVTEHAIPASATIPNEDAGIPQRAISARSPEGIAVEVTNQIFAHPSPQAVLASGDTWPDALTGAGFAGGITPFLFTDPDSLTPLTRKAIRTYVAPGGKIVIMGGSKAISPTVEEQIRALGYETQRIKGATREGTAVAIANAMVARLDHPDSLTVFIASRNNWADAVASGYLSAFGQIPVLLTNRDTVDPETLQFLASNHVDEVYVLGGTQAIGEAAVAQIAAATKVTPVRIAGATRVQTAANIASLGKTLYQSAGYDLDSVIVYDAYDASGWAQSLATSPLSTYGPVVGLGVNVSAALAQGTADSTVPLFAQGTEEYKALCGNRQIRLWAVGPATKGLSNRIGANVVKSCE